MFSEEKLPTWQSLSLKSFKVLGQLVYKVSGIYCWTVGHAKLVGEKRYAEMRTGVKMQRKSRINLEDLRDNVEFSSPVDDEVSIDSRLAIEAEVDKLRKELIREKAKT